MSENDVENPQAASQVEQLVRHLSDFFFDKTTPHSLLIQIETDGRVVTPWEPVSFALARDAIDVGALPDGQRMYEPSPDKRIELSFRNSLCKLKFDKSS